MGGGAGGGGGCSGDGDVCAGGEETACSDEEGDEDFVVGGDLAEGLGEVVVPLAVEGAELGGVVDCYYGEAAAVFLSGFVSMVYVSGQGEAWGRTYHLDGGGGRHCDGVVSH